MRIPNKVVCLWSCLTAFTFIHTAVAQDYLAQPVSDAIYVENAAFDEGLQDPYGALGPVAYQDEGAAVYGDPSAMYAPPAGYPPAMAPPPGTAYWPNISPFDEPVMSRTYRENGIWVNDSIYDHRTYGMTLEYLRVGFNRPGTDTIGDPDVGVPTTLQAFRQINTGVFNNGNDFLSDGVRATFVIDNADSSSLQLGGWWVGESQSIFHPFERGRIQDLDTLRARGFIGLDDGTDQGVAVPFDLDFELSYKQQAFGGDITYTAMPFFEASGFRLKPMFGVKYLKIREQFTLYGEDSGLVYLSDAAGRPINVGAILPNPFGNPPYSSSLTSQTKSDLAGGEVGVRYELGGKHFLLSGQSRLAIMANYERIELSGNQIGDGFGTGFPTPTPANPKPAAFRDGRTKTHVSPIFSQDFQFKGRVFKHIPILNDIPVLANADMLVGYNFVLVGNVARPTKVIDWRVNNPRIDLSHSRWYMQAATFGLQWEF